MNPWPLKGTQFCDMTALGGGGIAIYILKLFKFNLLATSDVRDN